ncbi:relaxase/mobilization nuclease domain-containing protein [Amycolatopsis rubida]|uniref:Relaxase/Mobilisation nuclease domain-containing protein n=1 Tax=Amycolatopsis rubida TaxID=112413 RepID=A0A1I5XHB2_9PSEU|nr:relaxase/mobilization nuclease domain-containing protein [Amycolatopsis rubida]SFQ31330.1 Relaxase/Mobilisation nuclease domain-containing protein [Amycolatopsis rubida]
MIGKALSGWRPAGLIAYLMGPGAHEEHRNPRIVASWDGSPGLHQPPKAGPGEFDFDLRALIGSMSELPKEFGLPLDNPAASPDDLPGAEEWTQWLRASGKKRPPAHAPEWVKYYRWDPKAEAVVLKPGYVWHCPVRLHPDDPSLSDEQWERIAQRLMEATGIHQSGCRWVAVRHADDHIHLMATLVTDKGGSLRRFYPRNDWYRLRKACRELERELGLVPTPEADWTATRRPTRQEIGKADRHGRAEPARSELRRLVAQAAAAASGPEDFFARLREFQVVWRPSYAADGTIRGCAYALADDRNAEGEPVPFSGGKLGRDLTWPKLMQRWASAPAAEPVERTADGRCTAPARLDVLDEAAEVVNDAAERIRSGGEDPAGIAHATAEVLGALALGTEYRDRGPMTTAFDQYDRASRIPGRILARDHGLSGRELRAASRRIAAVGGISGRGQEKLALAALILALAGLIAEIRAWQQQAGRPHHAAAAQRAVAALPVDRAAANYAGARSATRARRRTERTAAARPVRPARRHHPGARPPR